MATTFTNATFSNTYRDDFLDSDGYYRILFNSGRTLQARELTQMQTIIQKQIQRFGDNQFKEGSVVKEGQLVPNAGYEFIKLNTSVNTLPTNYASLVGTSFTGQTSGVIVKIIEVVPATGSDPATLYVQYTSTSASTASTTSPIRMQAGENIDNGSTTLTVQTTNTVTNRAVGTGYRISVGQGIYYTKGFFVFTDKQSVIISKYSDAPTADIGFKIIEDVVTVADDTGLYDNQGATPNISAPGADRYRIRLVITTRDLVDSDENFIHIASVKDGIITSSIGQLDAYNIPNQVVARRIKENSGDYTVRPFFIKFEEDSADNNYLSLDISDGVVVVDGYRAERKTSSNLRIQKAISTLTKNNDVSASTFGNYVIVSPTGNTKGIPNINTFEKLNLRDTVDYGGSTIGTARVRAITEDGANYKYHLFDIVMNSGQAFRDVKSIGTSVTNYFNPVLESSKAVLKDVSNNNLLFRLSDFRPKSISDISLTVQRRFATTTNVSGEATVILSATGETFANTGDWVFANADSDVFTGSVSVTGAGTASATVSGLPASSSNMEILAYVNKGNGLVRSKTLASRSITTTIDSDGNGLQYVPLGKADIYDLTEVVNASDSSESYETRFTLDNGQRDNFYALGRLVLNSGSSAPGGNIHVKYRHFNHGTSGDFFAVNSYTGQVDYADIPSHRLKNGTLIQLRDVLDFRSVVDASEEYSSTGTGARVSELPQPTDLITADIIYYLSQSGKLVIDPTGVVSYIKGEDAFEPRIPVAPDLTLPLYNIWLNPNTLNDSDVYIEKIEHKRYTMKDIANLEKRLDKVEELASLSLLEVATTSFEVLDSAGLNRTKAGVVVDNFTTHLLSQTEAIDYRASIDPLRQLMRPSFGEDNIRLIYDSDASTNTIRKGDNVYLKYSETEYINQNLASSSIEINPFSVVVHEGIVTLSPTSDEWKNVEYLQANVVDGGTKLNADNAKLWNVWEWNWGGISLDKLTVGSTTNKKVTNSGNTTTTVVNKVVADRTVRKEIGDRVVDVALIPWMRSRKVYFKVDGLRPNSKVFAFFDGKSVASWVRSESFLYYSDDVTDYGNTYNKATEHPEGSSTLQTDANGSVTGSFFIPSTSNTRFRTGTREFKILDISVNNESDALCVARANYVATGYLYTQQKDILSTRILDIQGNTTSVTRPSGGGGGGRGGRDGPDTNSPSTPGGGVNSGPDIASNNGMGNNSGGGGADGGSSGGSSGGCFEAGTLFKMFDGSLKEVQDIKPGDIMLSGGKVYAVMIGDGFAEDWYDYNGIHVTGAHAVFDNGTWKRIKDTDNKIPIEKREYYYSLMNYNHLMIAENGSMFSDYAEVNDEDWSIDILNQLHKDLYKKIG